MIKRIELVLLPEEAADKAKQIAQASALLGISLNRIQSIVLIRRSLDARSRQPKLRLYVDVYVDENSPGKTNLHSKFRFTNDISSAPPVLIIGCGPAGMFAALRLIELGLKPVILERGKNVRKRRRDLALITKLGILDPDSNYCFGEGGAGTYSDGKLYTRSGKRGNIHRILEILVLHGADENILVDAHPHIGTNKLPGVVENMRHTIINAGGEIHFETRLTDFIIKENKIAGVRASTDNQEKEFYSNRLILATGHSARDIFNLLEKRKILIEAKPFALGVRMEHPQTIIDTMQYHCKVRDSHLPPASYSITHQSGKRGVYSFCMCPGGIIAPAATGPGEIVVNGWSPSKRNNPFANSGLVVSVLEEDYSGNGSSPLDALHYQSAVEQRAFQMGGGRLKAPAQRLIDFAERKHSSSLPDCSYIPGITSIELDNVLPERISYALRESLVAFGKKLKPLYTNEAVLVATESRTSSPVRIPRDHESLQHPQIAGLFPCGEGAGFAGGIVSAAMDGERCAESGAKFNG